MLKPIYVVVVVVFVVVFVFVVCCFFFSVIVVVFPAIQSPIIPPAGQVLLKLEANSQLFFTTFLKICLLLLFTASVSECEC